MYLYSNSIPIECLKNETTSAGPQNITRQLPKFIPRVAHENLVVASCQLPVESFFPNWNPNLQKI